MCFHPTSMSWTGARVFCCPLALCASGTRRRPLLSKSETLRSALQAEHNGHGMRDAKWSISMRSQFPDMRNSAPLQNADVVVVLVPRRAAGASGCATQKWRSSRRAARLPVVLKAVVEVAASQGDDGVGSPDRPEHAGLFETRADYGLAAGFDDA